MKVNMQNWESEAKELSYQVITLQKQINALNDQFNGVLSELNNLRNSLSDNEDRVGFESYEEVVKFIRSLGVDTEAETE
ncbi:MAG: hypothetical protein CL489_09255 [Acidobacteria bacterium]|nr:hypothetical protein [Acidobacteriota bacterium]|tara:strand:+ start:6270 stop:6506 length:237 start_codon:yes stop_codon:yes gene_type:complete